MEFRLLSPLAKLGIWAGVIVAALTVIQAGSWVVGLEYNVLENGTPLLVVALISLLTFMSLDQRPISDYGLFVGPTWKKLWLCGIGTGLLTYGGYLGLAWMLGVYQFRTGDVSLGRGVKAFFTGMTGLPLAVTQQVIFSGYLLSMLRDRYHRLVAVCVSAAIFAVMNRIENLPSLAEPLNQQLMVGLFLVATLLGMLRLLSGSILIPAGLLAGWIFVRRFVGTLRLMEFVETSPYQNWLAPGTDPRQAPLMFCFLGLGIVACWIALRVRGEGKVPLTEEALDADFKRVFPLSHSTALAPLDIWLARLWEARFRVGLDYVPRLLAVLVLSTVNTILTLPERLVLPWLLKGRKVRDPVFIVGSPRSGTTHLHNLLALDPQFTTPRVYHMMNPEGCVFSGWLLVPIMAAFLPWRRPMDSVRFHVFSAQEEEFALAGGCGLSPYWAMSFPKMWPVYRRYMFPDKLAAEERSAWQRQYAYLLKKITFWTSKLLLLKNPYNTGRVAALHELYPNARFIHICRHPYDVYRSNLHLARQGHVVNQLQDPDADESYETRFLDYYQAMETACWHDGRRLPDNQWVHLRFEDMEQDTLAAIRQIYEQLNLEFTPEFERRLRSYLEGVSGYRKNRHRDLAATDKARIDEKMHFFLKEWGYEDQPATESRAA